MKIYYSVLFNIFTLFLLAALSAGCNSNNILFKDDFSELKPQMVSGGIVGAFAEYQNIRATQPVGNWIVSCFRSDGSQRAWRLIVENGKHIMYQSYTSRKKEARYTHPIIIAGDSMWGDYIVDAKFQPENKGGLSGIIFRYQTDREYYFFGVDGNKAVIMKVNGSDGYRESNQIILAGKKFNWDTDKPLNVSVNVTGNKIKASINDKPIVVASDSSFIRGRIGLMSDVPTRYYVIKVSANDKSFDQYEKRKKDFENEMAKIKAGIPKMVLWEKINTDGFGTGRSLRFGDLDNDGQIDILIGQVKNHGPKDRNSEVGCLTAINLEGKKLWQIGTPDLWNDRLTSDVAFQIYDIDGDGKNEVIYCKDMKLIVANGATGKVKYWINTPVNPAPPPHNLTPRILGDAIYICNVRGLKRSEDILLKDRYDHFYIYTNKLKLLWSGACKTGHYPYAWDFDNDGKDEIAIGYSLYDDNGRQIFSLDKQIKDHADGVAIVKLKKNSPYVIMNAASDEGLCFYDLTGKILEHYFVGHAQNPVVANLRDDLPGMEAVTVDFWGTQGIVNFYNSDMKIYKTFEPFQQGSPMLPINWTGNDEEFLVLSADPNTGGMIDGYGRKVVDFPADGHPDMCYAVLNIIGDVRDEVVVWDPSEIWIYTQSDNPKVGKIYHSVRNPLYNFSNYSTAVSYPSGWFNNKNNLK